MTEVKKDAVATDTDVAGTEPKTTSEQRREPTSGSVLGFEVPAKLDYWLNAQLLQMYSEVVSEPLPRGLLDLLEKLRDKKKDTP